MSAERSEFEIKITTAADLSGAKAAESELERLKAAGNGGLNEMKSKFGLGAGDLPKQLRDEEDGHRKAGEAAEHHAGQARMLHQALHPLVGELGPLGHILSHGLAEGFDLATLRMGAFVGAIYTATEAISKYFEQNAEFVKSLDAFAEGAAKGINLLEIQTAAMRESAVAANHLRLELAALNKPETHVQQEDDKNKRAQDLNALRERLDDAEYELAKSQVEALYTDEVAKRQALYNLEVQHEAQKRAAAEKADADNLKHIEREQKAAQEDANEANGKLPAAKEADAKAKAALRKKDEQIKDAEERKASRDKQAEETDKDVSARYNNDNYQRLVELAHEVATGKRKDVDTGALWGEMGGVDAFKSKSTVEMDYYKVLQAEQAKEESKALKGNIEKLKDQKVKLDEAADEAAMNLKALNEALLEAQKAIKKLTKEHDVAASEAADKKEERKQEGSVRNEAKAYEELAKNQADQKALAGKNVLTADEVTKKAELEREQAVLQARIAAMERENNPPPKSPAPANPGTVDMEGAELKRRQAAVDAAQHGVDTHQGNAGYEQGLKRLNVPLQDYQQRLGRAQTDYHDATVAVLQAHRTSFKRKRRKCASSPVA